MISMYHKETIVRRKKKQQSTQFAEQREHAKKQRDIYCLHTRKMHVFDQRYDVMRLQKTILIMTIVSL